MKKVRFFLMASAFIVGIGGAIATQHAKASGTLLFWFDENGNYLEQSTSNPIDCPDISGTECARGYTTVADPNNPVMPSGDADQLAYKHE